MASEEKLKEIKAEIRSLIVSSPYILTVSRFLIDYKERVGKFLPFHEFGYTNVYQFLDSLHDVVQIIPSGQESILVAVQNDNVSHINDLVKKQKKQKLPYSNFRSRPLRPLMICAPPADSPVPKASALNKDILLKTEEPEVNDEVAPEVESFSNSLATKTDDIEKKLEEIDLGVSSASESMRGDSPVPSHCSENISDQMKDNFRLLLQENPKGLSSKLFCGAYKDRFGCPLNIQDLGLSSFKELVISLPYIFTFEKAIHSHEWILHDARINPKKKKAVSKWIPITVLDNIAKLVRKYPDGINSSLILNAYEDEYKVTIDIEKLGFVDAPSFLAHCNGIDLKILENECIVFPKPEPLVPEIFDEVCGDSEEALPPIEGLKEIWSKYFSDDVCDPTYDYKKFVIPQSTEIKVIVSDVHSVNAIWCQPIANTSTLTDLMYALNLFYDDVEEKYLMNENIIKPGQICCSRFNIDDRWYRVKILEVKGKDEVKVCYVDYGTVNWVKSTSLRLLHKKFIEDPIQAIRAQLYNLEPLDGEKWTNEVNYYLFDLLHMNSYYAAIIDINESVPMMDILLIDTSEEEDVNINDHLIKNNMARCSAITTIMNMDRELENQANRAEYEKKTIKNVDRELESEESGKKYHKKAINNVDRELEGQENKTEYEKKTIMNVDRELESEENRAEYQEKDILNNEVSKLLIKVFPKLHPIWLHPVWTSEMNERGIEFLYKELQAYADGTLTNKTLDDCCTSHLVRSMFLNDAEQISKIWNNVITKYIKFLYEEFLNDVSKISPIDKKYFELPSFCEKFSTQMRNNETQKNGTIFPPDLKRPEGFGSEEDDSANTEKELSLIDKKQRANGDGSESCRSMDSSCWRGNSDYTNILHRELKKQTIVHCPNMAHVEFNKRSILPYTDNMSYLSKRGSKTNRFGVVSPLKYEQNESKLVFQTEMEEEKILVIVKLVNQVFVVQEQIIKEFTRGIPSMLLQYRIKMTDQTENVIITKQSHPGIFRSLKGSGILGSQTSATLIPFYYVPRFLRIVTPQDTFWAPGFEELKLDWSQIE